MLGSKGRSGFRNAQIFAGGCLRFSTVNRGLFLRVNLIPIADFELLTLAEKLHYKQRWGSRQSGDSLNGQRISYFVVGFHFLLLALQTGAQKLFGRCGFTCALDNLRKDDFSRLKRNGSKGRS